MAEMQPAFCPREKLLEDRDVVALLFYQSQSAQLGSHATRGVCIYNPSTSGGGEGPGVQGQLPLIIEFEAKLGYRRPCFECPKDNKEKC